MYDAPAVPAPIITPNDMQSSPQAGHLAQVERTLGNALAFAAHAQPYQLLSRLKIMLEDRRRRLAPLRDEWLDCYRRHNSMYSPDVLAKIGPNRSKIWIGITAQKDHAAHAAIMQSLKDPEWELEPDEIPEGLQIPPALRAIITDKITRAKAGLKKEMDFQLKQAHLQDHLTMYAHELVVTGSGALKGPFTVPVFEEDWQTIFHPATTSLSIEKVQVKGYRPDFSYCSVFSLFPDMESATVQGSSGIFEELLLSRSQLIELTSQPGFNPIAVLNVLRETPGGNAVIEPWMTELRSIGGDASPSDTSRYSVICFYGPITGRDLAACGVPIDGHLLEMQVIANIWWCGGHLLKAKRHPGKTIPYYISPYVLRSGFGPFGKGVPMLGKSSQDTVNAASRMMLDNAAIASGPLVEVVTDLLMPGEDPRDIHGWKVWLTKSDGTERKAVSIYEIPAYTDHFIKIIQMSRQHMDEETFVPSLTQGEQGERTTDTATGMSILNTNANRTFANVMLLSENKALLPLLEAQYQWNMAFNANVSLLARMKVAISGYAAIQARELKTQNLIMFAKMFANHPSLKTVAVMRKIARGMDENPDELVFSEDELMGLTPTNPAQDATQPGQVANMTAAQQQSAPPGSPDISPPQGIPGETPA